MCTQHALIIVIHSSSSLASLPHSPDTSWSLTNYYSTFSSTTCHCNCCLFFVLPWFFISTYEPELPLLIQVEKFKSQRPYPPCQHNKIKTIFFSLYSNYGTSLGTCPALPRKPHMEVKNLSPSWNMCHQSQH